MGDQLRIPFPLFHSGLFKEIREGYAKSEQEKIQEELKHLKHVVAGFKGYRTKRMKKNNG